MITLRLAAPDRWRLSDPPGGARRPHPTGEKRTMQRRPLLATAAAALAPRITIAQRAAKPLVFVPTADLSSLDPIWTTTQSVQTHGFYVFDTLFGVNAKL